ncbi:hypothetical protein [Paraburkholderia sp. BL25I1N1]|uniref:hypothetical protein n=1 Tax=Paraburkholderia sp. BL25I1N1 TaxID=1938804 RepID=UPI000D461702|nr:hypothetical protein [Paraburkholderia sp. BL25I1N1]PRY04055.1 hypothetical protein B0G73_11344 [Paraburkholderia sp. BL25I1N1]
MNRTVSIREAETAILLRMAETRAGLLLANSLPPSTPSIRGQTRSPALGLVVSLTEAPRVTLLLALCVGAIVLGPRRTVVVAGRSGITAWLGGTVRKVLRGETQAAAADSRSRSA